MSNQATDQTTSALTRFAQALSGLQAEFGPAVIAPPAEPSAPVAVLLPTPVRYCVSCRQFRPAALMRDADLCPTCPAPPWPEIGA